VSLKAHLVLSETNARESGKFHIDLAVRPFNGAKSFITFENHAPPTLNASVDLTNTVNKSKCDIKNAFAEVTMPL